jgi:two-component system, chemotaxis family, chemotaxis protein CheY
MASILVVDDSATMRQMVSFTLTEAGHEVHEAEDAQAALTWLDSKVPDLVITDVNMPGMNGIELVREIRLREPLKSKPILVLTTEHEPEMKARGREAGATGWIVKPFDPQALLNVLPRVLK